MVILLMLSHLVNILRRRGTEDIVAAPIAAAGEEEENVQTTSEAALDVELLEANEANLIVATNTMTSANDNDGFALNFGASSAAETKTIKFEDENSKFCQGTIGQNFEVVCSTSGKFDHGSSHVKLKNVVDYKWEVKNYQGHLIAVHRNGTLLAYGINVTMGAQREGMVRAVDRLTGSRALIKGMSGEVLDLQFANLSTEELLAVIDHSSLHIHKIISVNGTLSHSPIIKIHDPIKKYTPVFDRIVWCPFIERTLACFNEDEAHLIGWGRGSNVQLFYIKKIVDDIVELQNSTELCTIRPENISTGYITLTDNSEIITWLGISPDGSTMAVARTDGTVAFHQIYMFEKESRRLHQWVPHAGEPVSSIFFLENLNRKTDDHAILENPATAPPSKHFLFWTYAITAANSNTEFKVWDLSKFECLQKFRFIVEPEKRPFFVAELDRTANYLIISSYEERLLYVLEVADLAELCRSETQRHSCENGGNIHKENGASSAQSFFNIKSIAEFPLSAGILSFAVVQATVDNAQTAIDNYDEEYDSMAKNAVKIHMYIVQAKSVQECNVAYVSPDIDNIERLSYALRTAMALKSADKIRAETPRLSFLKKVPQTVDSSIIAIAAAAAADTPVTSDLDSTESRSISPISEDSADMKAALSSALDREASSTSVKECNNDAPALETISNDREQVNPEVYNTLQMLADFATKKPKADLIHGQSHNQQNQTQQQQQKKNVGILTTGWLAGNEGTNSRSSNSSPSREVQDILSNQELIGDELDEIITDSPAPALEEAIEIALTPISNNHDDEQAETETENFAITSKIWPVPIESLLKSKTNRKNIQQHSVSEATTHLDAKAFYNTMQVMMESMRDLNKEVKNLRQEVRELKSAQIQQTNTALSATVFANYTNKLEVTISKLLEQHLKRFENDYNKKIAQFLQQFSTANREFRENLLNITNQQLIRQLNESIAKTLNGEIPRKITPIYVEKLGQMHNQFETNIIQKFNKLDGIVKENLLKACSNKQFIDTLSKGIIAGMRGNMQIAFTESMSKALIPAYEKSSASMFNQLQGTFTNGVREILFELEKRANDAKTVSEVPQDLNIQFNNFKKQLEILMSKQSSTLTEAMLETCKEIKGIEIALSQQIRDVINGELQELIANQTFAIGGQANTNAITYDVREKIKQLLDQDEVNKAFHTSLLANDLSVVEFTLQQIDHSSVFSPKSRLEQKVLISLIQQLSLDMHNHNELKQNYLAEAVLALTPNDSVTKEHAPKVLADLYRHCHEFCLLYPKSPLATSVRMLLMAAQNRYGYQF